MRSRQLPGWACVVAAVTWSAIAGAQPFAYVANLGSDDVSVIDTVGLQPVATLAGGDDPDGVAVSADGRRVYVSGFLSDTVTIIESRTNRVLASVPVGAGPVGLAVTPDGARVYVAQRGADSVAAVGVASGTVEAVIPVGRGPNAIAITPDGGTAFVTNSFAPLAGEVSVLDLAADRVRNTIAVGRKPNRVAVTPDGRTAYVTNFRSWTSTAIDVASETVRTTFRAGLQPTGVAVNPNGAWAYVTDARFAQLLVVDVRADQVTRALPLGRSPSAIGVLRHGGTAYVSDFADDVVHVVDLGDEVPVAEVAVGARPFAVAVSCVGDACRETPYTPKPTKTATATPTATLTPSVTSTPTLTATATPTRTLPGGVSHVLFELAADATEAGGPSQLALALQPGQQLVHGVREQIALPAGVTVAAAAAGGLDCALGPQVAATRADFAVDAGACGPGCDGLSVAIDFATPTDAPALLYTCALHTSRFLPVGTLRLRHLDATALDGDGGALPSRARDALLVVAPPATPSPDLTPRPTRTPTAAAPPEVFIIGDPLTARPGQPATLAVRLDARGHAVAGAQNDLRFADGIAVPTRANGRPDCAPNPDIDKRATTFAFQPPGCVPGESCSGLRAFVLSFEDTAPIADGAVLYTCALAVAADLAPGTYRLTLFEPGASSPDGEPIPAGATDAVVAVEAAAALRRAVASEAAGRACTGGAADGRACADDADCDVGVCVRTQGVCDGGDDDGLLCDCAGGRCVSAGATCGTAPDAGVCAGGDADGSCCNRSFTCRGTAACSATARLCAAGPAKGSPCLDDRHCLGGACIASGRRCAGGGFDAVACIDAADCPAGACVDPRRPTPTRVPTAAPPPPGALRTSSGNGCAITPAPQRARGWGLIPVLALLAARLRRRRLSRPRAASPGRSANRPGRAPSRC